MTKRKITNRMLSEFECRLRNDEKSELTVEKYLRDTRCFMRFLRGDQADRAAVLAYKADLERRYAVASANSMCLSSATFLRPM